MKEVRKFPIDVGKDVVLRMPTGARPVCLRRHRGTVYLWCEVDNAQPEETRNFVWVKDEGKTDREAKHIDTITTKKDSETWHLYDPV